MNVEQTYSALDRLIHRIAFASPAVQLTAADIEATMFATRYRDVEVARPLFVTSLPRAGTTLILEVLSSLSAFATHSYRDMPFVMAPVLWDTLSKGFRKTAAPAERAHGDGMEVSFDSPEAFEEVLWRAFWPEHFKPDRIALWRKDEKAGEFKAFMVEHMRKIIALRAGENAAHVRYVSKNNANIARIDLLHRLFPDCQILLPFRNPTDHAASLLRQHQNFTERHATDAFSKRYMEDIGHLEFGALHRPIEFEGIDAQLAPYDPMTLDYWLAYWCASFTHILASSEDVILTSYERACADGSLAMRTLCGRLDLAPGPAVDAAAKLFRPAKRYDNAAEIGDRSLLDQANALHDRLLAKSVI